MTGRGASRRAYLGLGSNLGDRLAHLQGAVDGLVATEGVTVVAASAVYETSPVGGPPQPDYLNAVVAVDTDRSARFLLNVAQRLEAAAERVRSGRWGPRTLDVDVLLVGDEEVHEPDLEVPGGWGLWMARLTADALEISSDGSGTTVSIHASV